MQTTIDEKYVLVCADCMDVLTQMGDCSVDVTFTSPPYNDSAKTERDIETKRHMKYDKVEYRDDWLDWQIQVIDQLIRVTKRYVLYNVQAILSNKEDVYRLIGHYAEQIHQIFIWYKPNAQPQTYAHRIGNSYEMVILFRGKKFKNLYVNSEHYNNVIVQNINSNRTYSNVHRAMMSEPFSDEIIREFTQKNDIVFDPFMGLATTGVSCVKFGRKFVGTEINEPYYLLAVERLQAEASKVSFFDEESEDVFGEQIDFFGDGEDEGENNSV